MKKVSISTIFVEIVLIFVFAIIAILFFFIYLLPDNRRLKEELGDFLYEDGYIRTVDCVDIIDQNPDGVYKVVFDMKANSECQVNVFLNPVLGTKYYFSEMIEVVCEYNHYELYVSPVWRHEKENHAILFFSPIDSSVKITLYNLSIELVE